MLALLLTLAIFPVPMVLAEEWSGGDSGGGGTSSGSTYVTVNGGQNTLSSADSVGVTTSVTNITADNVTVYVEGDYNSTYLYRPRITELHMVNNVNGALWNPTIKELPNTLHAAVMKQAGIAILYDGWVDLENVGSVKPNGVTRAGEVLGYDTYAKLGEQYTPVPSSTGIESYIYSNGGLYSNSDAVNYSWAITQLYRAVGLEQVQFFVLTEGRKASEYNINQSPLAQFLTMATDGPDLSAVISNVAATRTDPSLYLSLAAKDCIGIASAADQEKQYLSVGEFCLLAYKLMEMYGEPVLTEQETQLLLQAYGRELPYGLPEVQLEAIKYLLARGIVEPTMAWRENIAFEVATTILMRIKDKGSRLTFKDIQLTADVGLLAKGYYPTEVSTTISPIEVMDVKQRYDTYLYYDYFVEVTDDIIFRAPNGNITIPFIGSSEDNQTGVLPDTIYVGRYTHKSGREFYHFQVRQDSSNLNGGILYVNTAGSGDSPVRYALSSSGNSGGYWLYTGGVVGEDDSISSWSWSSLDSGAYPFPMEFCDASRKAAYKEGYDTQLGLFNASSYGFTFRVYKDDLSKVHFKDVKGAALTLSSVTSTAIELYGSMSIKRESVDSSMYATFTVVGCSNRNTLSDLFTCDSGAAYQAFPAFAKQNDQYLVSIDYLKAIGAVWEFTKTTDTSYYIGVKSMLSAYRDSSTYDAIYTDVYVGTAGSNSYVIRGSQLTLYDDNTVVVMESDTGYYVDYSAILGVSSLVSFDDTNGTKTLTRVNGLDGLSRTKILNTNNEVVGTSQLPSGEWGTTVKVKNTDGKIMPYVYCPVTYPLANWLVVDNRIDGRRGVFTFFASEPGNQSDASKSGAEMLKSMLGAEMSGTSWQTYYTELPVISLMETTYEGGTYQLGKAPSGEWPAVAYIANYDAYLIKPNIIKEDGFTNYGQFVSADKKSILTSLVARISSTGGFDYIGDWNYNLYQFSSTEGYKDAYVRHMRKTGSTYSNVYCDMSAYTGATDGNIDTAGSHATASYTYLKWVPAPVGIPGLLGYPIASNDNLKNRDNVLVYSGCAYAVRGDGIGDVYVTSPDGSVDSSQVLGLSIIHATPNSIWAQSCGFNFTFLAGSPLGDHSITAPSLLYGDATSGFDWDQFFKDVGLQNADDWLTIAIIAVLNILPRVFMFAFVLLMGLALIADVKPWKAFCDNVFDPYRFLTLGRQDVHTIKLKMVFLYSMIALALFGLFQNGIILDVIAWVARAVTGILSR